MSWAPFCDITGRFAIWNRSIAVSHGMVISPTPHPRGWGLRAKQIRNSKAPIVWGRRQLRSSYGPGLSRWVCPRLGWQKGSWWQEAGGGHRALSRPRPCDSEYGQESAKQNPYQGVHPLHASLPGTQSGLGTTVHLEVFFPIILRGKWSDYQSLFYIAWILIMCILSVV